jgi:hypothetical protein
MLHKEEEGREQTEKKLNERLEENQIGRRKMRMKRGK